jgi:hypothetical protein
MRFWRIFTIVMVLLFVVTGVLIFFFSAQRIGAVCPVDNPNCNTNPGFDSGNPLGLPQPVISGLFLIGAFGTLISLLRGLWRGGAAIVGRLRGS